MMMRLKKAKHGFTAIELLVVITIIVLLLSLIVPTLSRAREAARRVICLSNQHQLYVAASNYSNDFKEGLPSYMFLGNVGYPVAPISVGYAGIPGTYDDESLILWMRDYAGVDLTTTQVQNGTTWTAYSGVAYGGAYKYWYFNSYTNRGPFHCPSSLSTSTFATVGYNRGNMMDYVPSGFGPASYGACDASGFPQSPNYNSRFAPRMSTVEGNYQGYPKIFFMDILYCAPNIFVPSDYNYQGNHEPGYAGGSNGAAGQNVITGGGSGKWEPYVLRNSANGPITLNFTVPWYYWFGWRYIGSPPNPGSYLLDGIFPTDAVHASTLGKNMPRAPWGN